MIIVQLVQSGAPIQIMSVWKRVWIWLNPETIEATKIRKSVEDTKACVNMIKRKGRYRFSGESWYRLTNALIKSIFIPNLFALFVLYMPIPVVKIVWLVIFLWIAMILCI